MSENGYMTIVRINYILGIQKLVLIVLVVLFVAVDAFHPELEHFLCHLIN